MLRPRRIDSRAVLWGFGTKQIVASGTDATPHKFVYVAGETDQGCGTSRDTRWNGHRDIFER
jgi:hypothetical protein